MKEMYIIYTMIKFNILKAMKSFLLLLKRVKAINPQKWKLCLPTSEQRHTEITPPTFLMFMCRQSFIEEK